MSGREAELVELVRRVLGLIHGDQLVIRETHLPRCTAHRDRIGWSIFLDDLPDRQACPVVHGRRATPILGWTFRDAQDLTDFLLGQLTNHESFYLLGEDL